MLEKNLFGHLNISGEGEEVLLNNIAIHTCPSFPSSVSVLYSASLVGNQSTVVTLCSSLSNFGFCICVTANWS